MLAFFGSSEHHLSTLKQPHHLNLLIHLVNDSRELLIFLSILSILIVHQPLSINFVAKISLCYNVGNLDLLDLYLHVQLLVNVPH